MIPALKILLVCSIMTQERLNGLATIAIENNVLEKINYEDQKLVLAQSYHYRTQVVCHVSRAHGKASFTLGKEFADGHP